MCQIAEDALQHAWAFIVICIRSPIVLLDAQPPLSKHIRPLRTLSHIRKSLADVERVAPYHMNQKNLLVAVGGQNV